MTTGIDRIAAERQRQIEQESFDAKNDDKYVDDELVRVALCYIASASGLDIAELVKIDFRDPWPKSWDKSWDKRSKHGRQRQLEIAGALIAAELDRLIRVVEANT